jgi:hypothetical protein
LYIDGNFPISYTLLYIDDRRTHSLDPLVYGWLSSCDRLLAQKSPYLMEGAQCLPIRFLGAATMTYAVSWGDHTTTPNLQPCKNKIPLLTDGVMEGGKRRSRQGKA